MNITTASRYKSMLQSHWQLQNSWVPSYCHYFIIIQIKYEYKHSLKIKAMLKQYFKSPWSPLILQAVLRGQPCHFDSIHWAFPVFHIGTQNQKALRVFFFLLGGSWMIHAIFYLYAQYNYCEISCQQTQISFHFNWFVIFHSIIGTCIALACW